MAIMTKEQFQDSIRARKPMNVWFLGEKIEDLTTFPVLSASFNAISKVYELHNHPDWEDLLTIKSDINGEKVSIYNAPLRSPEDANRKTRAARALAEVIGCCTHRCTGSEAFAGLGPCTYDMDHDLGTDYFKRFTNFIDYVQKNDLSCTVTVTDVKGLRTLPPHKQPNRDNYIHVDEIRDDGIVISGFKCNQTGILFAHEIIIIPTTNMKPEDKDFALACAIPADARALPSFWAGRHRIRDFSRWKEISRESISERNTQITRHWYILIKYLCRRRECSCAVRPPMWEECSATLRRCIV